MARHFKQEQGRAAPEPATPVASQRTHAQTAAAHGAKQAPARVPAQISLDDDVLPPHRRRGGFARLLSNLLIVVGVALLAVAGYLWGKAQLGYHEQDVVNKRLQEYVTVVEEDAPEGPVAPQVDWAGLKAVNDEVVGWLQIPGTVVNYPVYQHDDNEYYLDYSAEGVITVGGQLFLDYECTKPGMVDPNTLIYGHHQKDGSMFQAVAKLDDQEAFDATETVWYVTEEQAYECEPLLLYYTQPDDQDVRTFSFKNKKEFATYLEKLVAKAQTKRADAEQVAAQAEHVLCLITCNYYDGYGRTVLVCVPKSEAQTGA